MIRRLRRRSRKAKDREFAHQRQRVDPAGRTVVDDGGPLLEEPDLPPDDTTTGGFVARLLEGDPDLERTLNGVPRLRKVAREAIGHRYVTLDELRWASPEDLLDLPGVGPVVAGHICTAARPAWVVEQVPGVTRTLGAAIDVWFPSLGAVLGSSAQELSGVPEVDEHTARAILKYPISDIT